MYQILLSSLGWYPQLLLGIVRLHSWNPLFITLQLSSITFTACGCVCVGGSKAPFITFQIFSLLSQPWKILIQVFIVLKPGIICKFLIHFGSLQKMLTALFNLVWNTQKSKWTILFDCQDKMLLCIEKFLEKISEDQP